MNLLKAAIHPVIFWISWGFSGSSMLVIDNTFSGLWSIPYWEIIYLSKFPEGTLNVHFLGFSFIFNFIRLSKVSAKLEMSHSSS
jgi:hypothetical protein